MAWIKRNKFFAIGCVLALGLLGAAGFYDYQSWSRNETALAKLNDIYGNLKRLTGEKPSPGNDKIKNIETAKEQESNVRAWMSQTGKFFQPIDPIPRAGDGTMKTDEFARALSRTIDQLQRDATNANVALPPDYGFSFTAERNRVTFAPGSLKPLSEQMGEVRALAEILFAARVNSVDSMQRVRVSDEDMAGLTSDYIGESSETNELAVLTPYQITFRAFSPEIAQTLAGFENSPHGFIVKGINVQRATAGSDDAATGGVAPPPPPPETPPMQAGRGGLQTVLKEQLLRVTLQVEIVKLLPKN